MILHDLRCLRCGAEEQDVQIRGSVFPRCPACRGKRTWIPRKLNTDMGSGFYCEATGQTHSRHRDAELEVARQARDFTARTGIRWEPGAAGDKVHGARNETKIGAAFGYAGQATRKSTAERYGSGGAPKPPKRAPSEQPGSARRMTAADVAAMRKAPVYTGPIPKH